MIFSIKTAWWWSMLVMCGLVIGLLAFQIKKGRIVKTETYFGEVTNWCLNDNCFDTNGKDVWITQKTSHKAPTDKEKGLQFWEDIKNVYLSDLVSVNSDNFAHLGFNEDKLVLKSNGKILEIGNVTDDYRYTFVKVDNKIYKIRSVWNKEIFKDSQYWLNQTITNLPIYQIIKVVIENNDKQREIIPSEGKWRNDKWLEKISSLKSETYLGEDNYKDDINTYKFNIEADSGKSELIIGKTDTGKAIVYWASSNNIDYYSIKAEDYNLLSNP